MGAINQFREAIRAAGLTPPDDVEADGKLRRFGSNGKRGDDAGWYVLHDDAIPAGCFGDWRTNLMQSWRADIGRSLTPAEEAAHRARVEAMRQQRETEEAKQREEAATKAKDLWDAANPATGNHGYLRRKGINPHGVRVIGGGACAGWLAIPMRDADGKLWNVERIAPEKPAEGSDKKGLFGGKRTGCYFSIGKPGGVICIAEGFATGATIHEATGHAVAVAFNAGNLSPVAKVMREKFPDARLILCADDDIATPGNPGMAKATEAARSIGGLLAIPNFGENRPEKATDFNDMAAHCGLDAVQGAIANASEPGMAVQGRVKENALAGDCESPDWPEALPIPDGLLPVEKFEAALLPAALRPWISDIAERMQCPIDFPAVGAMVALSSVIGRKACLYPKRHDDWHVVPNLWGAIVGRPGVMKSPALSEAIKPLDRLAVKANELHAEAMRDYKLKERLNELADKADEKKAQDLVRKGKHAEAEQLLAASMDYEGDPAPALRRYKVTDASVEALGEVLIENPFGTLAYRDELNGLLRSLDKEGQEGARAFYLQGYDGNQGYTFDRIMRGRNLHIPAVCIAMLGGIQPGKLQAYIRDAVSGGAGDDGLLQRFGLLVWPDIGGEWRNVDRWADTEAKRQAFAVFERLDAMQPGTDPETGEPAPVAYRFTVDAQTIFDEWRHDLETGLRSGEHHPAMESHLSKYRKLAPALALVCALADSESEVGRDALLRALAWIDYLRSHAMRAYTAGTRPATDGAKALLTKIKTGAVSDGFKPADVYLKGWAHLGNPEEAHAAINMLCDLGHLRRVEILPGVRGGRPSITYQINPASIGRA